MAVNARLLLPPNRTLKILLAAVLVFGMNIIIAVLRTIATMPKVPVAMVRDLNHTYHHIPSSLGELYTALGCDHVGNGSLEVSPTHRKCKRRILRAVLAVDSTGILKQCGFEEEYNSAIKGTPLQPLKNFQNPCWASYNNTEQWLRTQSDAASGLSGLGALFQTAPEPPWQLRCFPGLMVTGSQGVVMDDLVVALSLHPRIHYSGGQSPWLDYSIVGRGPPCRGFSTYIDGYTEAAELLMESTVRVSHHHLPAGDVDLQHDLHPGLTFEVAPDYLHEHTGWEKFDGNNGESEPVYLVPHVLSLINPDLRLIVILRNPIDRWASDFQATYRHHREMDYAKAFDDMVRETLLAWKHCIHKYSDRACAYNSSFMAHSKYTQAASQLRASLYSVFLRDWLQVLPKEQVLMVLAEDYTDHRMNILQNMFTFLGLEQPSKEVWKSIENQQIPRKRHFLMADKTRRTLQKFFELYNSDLVEILHDSKFTWS